MTENTLYLAHHGVKGMKWGVRRYQNKDGSLTTSGKKRYSQMRKMDPETKKRLLTGAAVGVGVGVGVTIAVLAMKNPAVVSAMTKLANKSVTEVGWYAPYNPGFGAKAANAVKNFANSPATKYIAANGAKLIGKTAKFAENVITKSGEAAANAAVATIGAIAITKIASKVASTEDGTERTANRNKIIVSASTAAIETATNSKNGKPLNSSNNNNSNNNNSSNSAKYETAVGKPSGGSVDKQGSEWAGLFKDSSGAQRDSGVKNEIRDMANKGYDINQIQAYLRKLDEGSIAHSDFSLNDIYAKIGMKALEESGLCM